MPDLASVSPDLRRLILESIIRVSQILKLRMAGIAMNVLILVMKSKVFIASYRYIGRPLSCDITA
jgi:hypothetical protein